MPNHSKGTLISARYGTRLIAAAALLILCSQSACLFFWKKKSKAPSKPPRVVVTFAPVRVVFLPFNVSANEKNLRWTAFAAPILLAKVSEQTKDLVVVPLWEAMPSAIQSAGASRTFTQESAASVAVWLAAKWSTTGEITSAPTHASATGVSMMLDFIPGNSSQFSFRYLKTGKVDGLGSYFREAVRQFLHYIVARPLATAKIELPGLTSIKSLSEALDREYGWFQDADPGKAQEVVGNLARSDARLARILFNPSVYPVLAEAK